MEVVERYVSGKDSLQGICKKYRILDERHLRAWIQERKEDGSAIL